MSAKASGGARDPTGTNFFSRSRMPSNQISVPCWSSLADLRASSAVGQLSRSSSSLSVGQSVRRSMTAIVRQASGRSVSTPTIISGTPSGDQTARGSSGPGVALQGAIEGDQSS
jgi:hypothetical protein